MSLDNTLLKIRREYSGNEKYRLFLKHLDNVEAELKAERTKLTNTLKENVELSQKNKALRKELHELKEKMQDLKTELGEYKATEPDKKFVRMKAYKRSEESKSMWEKAFWEKHAELEKLKNSIQSP